MSKKQKTTSKAAKAQTKSDPNLVPLTKAMAKPAKVGKRKSLSALDGAAQVLKSSGKPMRCLEIVETLLEKKLWSTQGKTPGATLYSAILREMQTKGSKARFKKTDRGLFAFAGK